MLGKYSTHTTLYAMVPARWRNSKPFSKRFKMDFACSLIFATEYPLWTCTHTDHRNVQCLNGKINVFICEEFSFPFEDQTCQQLQISSQMVLPSFTTVWYDNASIRTCQLQVSHEISRVTSPSLFLFQTTHMHTQRTTVKRFDDRWVKKPCSRRQLWFSPEEGFTTPPGTAPLSISVTSYYSQLTLKETGDSFKHLGTHRFLLSSICCH